MIKALKVFILSALLFPHFSWAEESVEHKLDQLGGNAQLYEKAKILSPEEQVTVVQDRWVSRKNRSEFLADYSYFLNGSSYLETQALGLGYQFSFNQYFSIGAKYFSAFNGVSKEGQALVNNDFPERLPSSKAIIPDLDPVQSGYYGLLTWSPIYGKMRVASQVVHFDVYGQGGYGQVTTKNISSPSLVYGLGISFWLTQHFSARLELRQQTYKTKPFSGEQDLRPTISSLSLGYML